MRILVTGASGALGSAIMENFRTIGLEPVGVSRSSPGMLNADLTNPDECARVVREAGRLDGVVHAMGGFTMGGDNDAWQYMLDINLKSSYYLFNAVLPDMKKRGHGALIAVGSRAAVEPSAGIAAYAASKAALVHYVRTLAIELKDTGVRANIVLPSTINTEANRAAMPQANHSEWVPAESIAKVVCWLASEGSRDVSGAVVPVYGRA